MTRLLLRLFLAIAATAVFTTVLALHAFAQMGAPTPGLQVEQSAGGEGISYLLFLPNGFNTSKTWPVLVYLHGAGFRGTDISRVSSEGLPKLLDADSFTTLDALKNNFIVISPQCPAGSIWFDEMDRVLSIVDTVCSRYEGNKHRVYLAGHSLGGAGTLRIAAHSPGRWAALVVVSGGIAPHWGGPELAELGEIGANVPIWIHHGDADGTIPYTDAVSAVQLMQNSGGPPFVHYQYPAKPGPGQQRVFTTYPQMGHNIDSIVFEDPDTYTWLLHWTTSTGMVRAKEAPKPRTG